MVMADTGTATAMAICMDTGMDITVDYGIIQTAVGNQIIFMDTAVDMQEAQQ